MIARLAVSTVVAAGVIMVVVSSCHWQTDCGRYGDGGGGTSHGVRINNQHDSA